MKRNYLIKKLLSEGFNVKTLVIMNDHQLRMLSERIFKEEEGEVTMGDEENGIKPSSPNAIANTPIKKAVEKGGKIDVSNMEIKENGKKFCKEKNINETLPKVLKNVKELPAIDPSKKATLDVKKLSPDIKKEVVGKPEPPENGKKRFVNDTKPVQKSKPKTEVKPKKEKKKTTIPTVTPGTTPKRPKTAFNNSKRKKAGYEKTDQDRKREVFLSKQAERENKKKKDITEWVENLVEKEYYSNVTTKNEIMELLEMKLHEVETATLSKPKTVKKHSKMPEFMTYDAITSNQNAPAPVVKPKPSTVPTKNPVERPKPRTPYQPGPGTNPKPKATLESKNQNTPAPVVKPKPTTVPTKNPVERPKPRTPYQPGPGTNPKPKALKEKKELIMGEKKIKK